MISQISAGENVCCDFKENSSSVLPDRHVVKLSTSVQSFETFRERDNKLSQSTDSPNVSGTVALVTAFDNNVNIAEVSEQKHGGRRDIFNADDAFLERKCPETVCMTPPRSRLKSLSLQSQVKLSARNGRKGTTKIAALDISNLNFVRRKRTTCSKQIRSSVWGSLQNVMPASVQGSEKVKSDKRKSRKQGKKSKKRENKRPVQSFENSMAKNRISLKVKFGQRSLMDVLPLIKNDNGTYPSIGGEPVKGLENTVDQREDVMDRSTGLHGSSENIGDQFQDEINIQTGLNGLGGSSDSSLTLSDTSFTNMFLAGKNIVESPTEKFLESHHESLTLAEVGKLGTPLDDNCSNPETSPDSEVINIVPDSHVSVKGLENLHGLMSTQASAAPADVASCGMLQNSRIEENASGSMSSSEICAVEPQTLSKVDDLGISTASPKFEPSAEVNLCPSLDACSQELQLPEKSFSSKKLKLLKKGKSKGIGQSQSDIPNSRSKPDSCKKKAGKGKQSSKFELKKPHSVEGLTEFIKDPETESQTQSHLGQNGFVNKISGLGISNQTEGHKEHLSLRNAWVQCDDCQKWRRIPAVLADQIEETNCKWVCKNNMDKYFADCSVPQEKSNSAINAELEISDDEDASLASLNHNCSGKKSTVDETSSWTLIKSNLFLHRARKSQTIDEVMVCHCKPPSDGRMGCGEGCLNRMLNIECVHGTCPCGERCSNQQFQSRNYAKLKWFKCGKKGYGLQLLEDVAEGQFLIEYVGEVLDMLAYERRLRDYSSKGHKHFYFMTLNGSEVIDACAKGNLGRFINHSCDPNCSTEKWMVNGEVCIGLFALRDIKKGEEVTFDYNYVRVFGAAAKKCVCGSSQCRGYIGGDTLNAEVIVQDDSDVEYPEPVVACEDRDLYDELNYIKSAATSFSDSEIGAVDESENNDIAVGHGSLNSLNSIGKKNGDINCPENIETSKSAASIDCLKTYVKSGDLLNSSSAVKEETSAILEGSGGLESSADKEEGLEGENVVLNSLCSLGELEVTFPTSTLSKLWKNSEPVCAGVKTEIPKSCPVVKVPRISSTVKKAKSKSIKTSPDVGSRPKLPEHKLKKPSESSLNGRFEAVEEKLNELLDPEGGISKRKDASKCYLKLLVLTAASGDSGNSETIQSNRELSMILDALLKTKSRTVLADVINKNGLQMLHNIMKKCRKEFNKIPILRKLLKVLEYLALRDILTFEDINGGPSRLGVESFKDSILSLTEHIDKQVHQIARSFRDRWIPRSSRKNCLKDRDEGRMDFHAHSTDNCAIDNSTLSNEIKIRKRKSRWDLEAKTKDDYQQDKDDAPPGYDFPPGFSPPINNLCTPPNQPIMGQCQHRFNSHLPVSFGVPFNMLQQFGTPLTGTSEGWSIAPGVPFHPYPPLPTYPRGTTPHQPAQTPSSYHSDQIDHTVPSRLSQPSRNCFQDHTVQNPAATISTTRASQVATGEMSQQRSNGSFNLGRRYFRQQKWNGSKLPPPWLRKRKGYTGNNPKNGMCNGVLASGAHGPVDVGIGRDTFPPQN